MIVKDVCVIQGKYFQELKPNDFVYVFMWVLNTRYVFFKF